MIIIYRMIEVSERLPEVANENYLTISERGIETSRFFNGKRFETAHYEGEILYWLERCEIDPLDVSNLDRKMIDHAYFVECASNERLINELTARTLENDNLIYCLKQMADYYIHEKEMEDNDLKLMQERVIDLLSNPNAI